MSIAIISHDDCLLHKMPEEQPERPNRLKTINAALKKFPFQTKIDYYEAPLVDKDKIKRVHDSDYIDLLFTLSPHDGFVELDFDTFLSPGTLNAALRAVGAVILATDLVMKGEAEAAFCSIRPPGHHAEIKRAMGFCFFNNVALGVQHLIDQYGLKRIAVIDFDVHHGNGTQDIFQNNEQVLFCSSFEDPLYPGYDPEAQNDHIVYLPLRAGTDGETYRNKVKEYWLDKIREFSPEFILISAGFDAHYLDPLGHLNLKIEDYEWITKEIVKIAKDCCQGRIVSVLEGGYSLEALAETVPVHVNALV